MEGPTQAHSSAWRPTAQPTQPTIPSSLPCICLFCCQQPTANKAGQTSPARWPAGTQPASFPGRQDSRHRFFNLVSSRQHTLQLFFEARKAVNPHPTSSSSCLSDAFTLAPCAVPDLTLASLHQVNGREGHWAVRTVQLSSAQFVGTLAVGSRGLYPVQGAGFATSEGFSRKAGGCT